MLGRLLRVVTLLVAAGGCRGDQSCMVDPDPSGLAVFPRQHFVPEMAFYGCTALRSALLPDTVTAINARAFADCTGITAIDFIPNSVTTVAAGAFWGCVNVRTVVFPQGVLMVPQGTFDTTVSLVSVSHYNTTSIEPENFPSCVGFGAVPKLSMPVAANGSILSTCFPCKNTSRVALTNNLTLINAAMFYSCHDLTSIFIPPLIDTIKYFDKFIPCFGLGLQVLRSRSSTHGNVTCIPCANQTHLAIPPTVVGIGKLVFAQCVDVVTLGLPDTLLTIDDSAFAQSTALKSVIVPPSVTSIGDYAFAGCYSLETLSLPRYPLTWVSESAFPSCLGLGLALTTGLAPPRKMPMAITCLPCVPKLVIPDTVSMVGTVNPFATPDSSKYVGPYTKCPVLQSVSIPNSVTTVQFCAFLGCTALATLSLSNELHTLGELAFAATNLTEVALPSKLTVVPPFAFAVCRSLAAITLGPDTTAVAYGAFMFSRVTTVVAGPDLRIVGPLGFGWNPRLASVQLNAVTLIDDGAFLGCSNLTLLRLPPSLRQIEGEAFSFSGLRTVSIPSSVSQIDPTAFANLACNRSLFVAGRDVCNCTRCSSLPPTSAAPTTMHPTPHRHTPTPTPPPPTSACTKRHETCDLQSTQCAVAGRAVECVCRAGFVNVHQTDDGTFTCTPQGLSSRVVAIITSSVVLGVAALLCGLAWTLKLRGRSALERVRTAEDRLQSSEGRVRLLQRAWEISSEHIHLDQTIAQGAYGSVHKGRWGLDRVVAIKILNRRINEDDDPEALETFRNECATLQAIRNPHLLVFFGAGMFDDGRAYMVTEYMPRGSLRMTLRNPDIQMVWGFRIRIAIEIATGVRHLHRIGIVHRDLKSDNVLLSDSFHAKVADFGTSRFVWERQPDRLAASQDGDATMTRAVGTQLWMAPEVFLGATAYGPEVDTYSFGIIMHELCTRKQPWSELEPESSLDLFEKLNTALRAGRRPSVPPEPERAQPQFVALMRECWLSAPEARPTPDEIISTLHSIRKSLTTVDIELPSDVLPSTRPEEPTTFSSSDPQRLRSPSDPPEFKHVYEDEAETAVFHATL